MKITLILVLTYVHILQVAALTGNNACKTYQDYFTLNSNRNCWFDPDFELNTPQLIEKYVGEVQEYRVTTEDGYVLTVHRLPRPRAKGVIYMQHSLQMDSRAYMSQGNFSLALVLWRAGYDVWLGNQRGTLHSEGHVRLSPADFEYWNFSFHEIGQYDVSAMIRLVRSKTGGSKVVYYGHSLGSTNGLIYASMRPDEAHNSVKAFILTSSAHRYVHFTRSIVAGIAPFAPVARGMYNTDFFVNLRNASWHLMIHYMQLIHEKNRFQMFDYGPERNRKIYGSDRPHLYPLENITVPVYMISSRDDFLTPYEDDAATYETLLTPRAKIYGRLVIDGMSHFCQMWCKKDKKKAFNDHVLGFLKRIQE